MYVLIPPLHGHCFSIFQAGGHRMHIDIVPFTYPSDKLSEPGADHEAHIIIVWRRTVKEIRTTIGRNVEYSAVMAPKSKWIAPWSYRIALAIKARHGTKCGIFAKQLSPIVGIEKQLIAGMAQVAAGSIDWFEWITTSITKTCANCPASLLLKSSSTRLVDHLKLYSWSGMSNVFRCTAWCYCSNCN